MTFRKLSPGEVVDLAARAGLEAVEWGGDVHVRPGDVRTAREVAKITRQAGLKVASYGSYYRAGHEEEMPFEFVLEAAKELGAPLVRVWAGRQGSAKADGQYRARVVRDSQRVAQWAADLGIQVAFEFHAGTLTDTSASARRLLEDIANDNVRSYWQPSRGLDADQCLEALQSVLPWLSNLHVFHWDRGDAQRLPLSQGRDAWSQYLRKVGDTGRDHYAMLEFVRDDSPAAFLEDAATLRSWLTARQ